MAGLPIIGILAAIAAVYAILPDHRRLRVQYSLFGILPLAILSIASCAIVAAYAIRSYLQAPTRTSVGQISTNAGTLVLDATAIELIQLVATLCIVVLFVWVFAADSVRIRNESSLVTLLRTLQNRGEYATLVDIIDDNYTPLISTPPEPTKPQPATLPEAISQALEIELGLSEPEPTYYIDGSVEYHLDERQNKPDSGCISSIIARVHNRFDTLVYKFGNWQYHRRRRSEAASYTESLLLDPDFSSQHPLLAPRLGLRIIADDTLSSFPRRAFTHRFLSVLIESNNSLLFREIRQNHGMTISPTRYKLDSKYSLLQILFNDCELAEDLDVYKPIGDQTRDLLQEQRYKDQDKYNKKRLQNGDIYNEDVLDDPIFAGIQFFDIMIREAFYQRISWHMWLYYYETFTETICANYQLPPNADRTTEWPNDYSRFLYEMIDNMRDWIKMVEEMIEDEDFDIEQSNSSEIKGEDTVYRDFIRLDRIDSNRGANIPKSTVICMISCHQEIMTTDEIPKSFKSYTTDIVFRCCLDLYQHDDGTLPQKYGELMISCIETEANNQYSGKKYRQETKQVYRTVGMNTGVRHELIVKDIKMTDLVDRIDGILEYHS